MNELQRTNELQKTNPTPRVTNAAIAKDTPSPELVAICNELNALQSENRIKMVIDNPKTPVLNIAGKSDDIDYIISRVTPDQQGQHHANAILSPTNDLKMIQFNDPETLYQLKRAGLQVENLSKRPTNGRLAEPQNALSFSHA